MCQLRRRTPGYPTTPHLTRPAAVVCDDAEGNRAFEEWAAGARPDYWALARQIEKPGLMGVAGFAR